MCLRPLCVPFLLIFFVNGITNSYQPHRLATQQRSVIAITLRQTLTGNLSIAFSPNGQIIATASRDKTVRVWDTATGALKTTLPGHKEDVISLAFSPDGRTVATGSDDKTARLWDTATGQLKATLSGHRGGVHDVAFSRDGLSLLTIGACPLFAVRGCKGQTKLWDVTSGKLKAESGVRCGWLSEASFSADGRNLVSTCSNSEAEVWDVQTGKLKAKLRVPDGDRRISNAMFSPDGRILATGDSSYRVQLWDTQTWQLNSTLDGQIRTYHMEFGPDSKLLVTGGVGKDFEGVAELWDVTTGQLMMTLSGNYGGLRRANFSPDGGTLATDNREGRQINLWEVATGKLKAALPGPKGNLVRIFFSPNGRIVGAAGRTVEINDAVTGRHVTTLENASHPTAFSADGGTLATAGLKDAMLLWEVIAR